MSQAVFTTLPNATASSVLVRRHHGADAAREVNLAACTDLEE
jgi:hypothetical protein